MGVVMRQTGVQRGVVLAATLACLFLAILLSAGLAASAVSGHRRLEQQTRRHQALWLAESAAGRAAAQLRRDPSYPGETWSVPAADLGGLYAGKVVIQVVPDENDDVGRRVNIEADYPDDPLHRIRITKELTLPAPDPQ